MNLHSQPRIPAKLSESVHRQLNMYALAASAAGVGLLALAKPAEGKVVYTPAHVVIGYGGLKSYQLDLSHDKKPDFTLQYNFTWASSGGFQAYAGLYLVPAVGNGARAWSGGRLRPHSWDYALKPGACIGRKKRFSADKAGLLEEFLGSDNVYTYGAWVEVKNRYLGLKFKIKGETHYGWARLNVVGGQTNNLAITGTLTGYAYETIPNKAIFAGKTKGPDVITVSPGSLGQLASGRK